MDCRLIAQSVPDPSSLQNLAPIVAVVVVFVGLFGFALWVMTKHMDKKEERYSAATEKRDAALQSIADSHAEALADVAEKHATGLQKLADGQKTLMNGQQNLMMMLGQNNRNHNHQQQG